MQILKQSTAVDVLIGPFLDLTDAATAEAGETPVVKLSKNGQALAAKSDITVPVYDADGYYNCELDATDTNTVGTIVLTVAKSATALPIRHEYQVVEESVYDNMYGASAVGPLTAALVNAEADTALSDFFTSSAALVDAVWDEALTVATHNVANSAGRRLRNLQESGSAYGGFIWIDTINGTAGTSDYENGTSDNPVDTIADANTLAASLGIDRFMVAPGSSITFAATQSNESFHGKNWTLALGGQSIAGTYIEGATVTGIGTGSNYHFFDCHIGTCTLADGDMSFCSLDGTLTLSGAATYRLNGCYSGIAGAATPTVDFGAAVGNTSLNMRHYSGGVTINNKDATGTDTMSLEGNGKLVVAASSSGAISVRGNFEVTNTGGATITYDDNTQGLVDIEADTGTDGVAISTATQTAIADALLNRDMSAVSDTTARSPLNALRLLRNKYSVSGSTLTVTKEDDTTSAWTSALTTDATADPVTGSDPA